MPAADLLLAMYLLLVPDGFGDGAFVGVVGALVTLKVDGVGVTPAVVVVDDDSR